MTPHQREVEPDFQVALSSLLRRWSLWRQSHDQRRSRSKIPLNTEVNTEGQKYQWKREQQQAARLRPALANADDDCSVDVARKLRLEHFELK